MEGGQGSTDMAGAFCKLHPVSAAQVAVHASKAKHSYDNYLVSLREEGGNTQLYCLHVLRKRVSRILLVIG